MKKLENREVEALAEIQVNSVPMSEDVKTGMVTALYSSRNTCPIRCPYKGCGCYGEQGPCNCVALKVDQRKWGVPASMLAEQVCQRGVLDIVRVNVVGDMAIPHTNHLNGEYVKLIAKTYNKSQVYTYTHCSLSTRNIKIMQEALHTGFVINASCEKFREVHKALDSGLPATIVVKKMTENTKVINGIKYIKCPNQVTKGKIQCRECKLCMKGNRKEVVVFEWHSRVKPPKVVMESL